MIETTKEMVSWNNCQCGEQNCQTVWRECLAGIVSIIPVRHAFTVKGQGGRDKVQIIPVGTLMQAVKAAEDLSKEYGGWL
jgi:hypothetical protein